MRRAWRLGIIYFILLLPLLYVLSIIPFNVTRHYITVYR